MRLLLDTGIRDSELVGLDLTDVDLDREPAYVVATGSRPRVVPLGAKTAQTIDRYLRIRAFGQRRDSSTSHTTRHGGKAACSP